MIHQTKGGSGASGTGLAVQKAAAGLLAPDVVHELRSNVDVLFLLVQHPFRKHQESSSASRSLLAALSTQLLTRDPIFIIACVIWRALAVILARNLETAFGKPYIEGYGLSETMSPTHINPLHRPKRQCAGIPIFDVDARVLDPDSLTECGPNQVGEIVVHGPQLFQGYWRQPEASAEAFLDHDGKRFFRTGDLGYYDEEGYFFITERLKRMINASGFKVWPAEVEAMLYAHPDIQEVCVIGVRDPYRGETVKAVVVPTPAARGSLRAQAIIDWARERMATYKVPREVELVAELPKTATGKVFWRKVQEEEDRRAAGEGAESAS